MYGKHQTKPRRVQYHHDMHVWNPRNLKISTAAVKMQGTNSLYPSPSSASARSTACSFLPFSGGNESPVALSSHHARAWNECVGYLSCDRLFPFPQSSRARPNSSLPSPVCRCSLLPLVGRHPLHLGHDALLPTLSRPGWLLEPASSAAGGCNQ